MERFNPTTQPITDVNELIDNSVINIIYKDEDTELQNSELQWKGKKYKIVERVLKSNNDIVEIVSKTEIINSDIDSLKLDIENIKKQIGIK